MAACAFWPSIGLLWRKVHSGPLLIFYPDCFCRCCWIIGLLHIFCISTPYLPWLQSIFPILWTVFSLCRSCLLIYKSFNLHKIQCICFSFCCLWCHIQEIIAKSNAVRLSTIFLQEFYISPLTFRSLIHLELILVCGVRRLRPSVILSACGYPDFPVPLNGRAVTIPSPKTGLDALAQHLFDHRCRTTLAITILFHWSTVSVFRSVSQYFNYYIFAVSF